MTPRCGAEYCLLPDIISKDKIAQIQHFNSVKNNIMKKNIFNGTIFLAFIVFTIPVRAHSADKPESVDQSPLTSKLPSSWKAIILDKPVIPKKQHDTAQNSNNGNSDRQGGNNSGANSSGTETKTSSGAGGTNGTSGPQAGTSGNVAISQASTILIPVSPDVGIAAWQSGRSFFILLDTHKEMDLSALRGIELFSGLSLKHLSGATLITIPLPEHLPKPLSKDGKPAMQGQSPRLYLAQKTDGWLLSDERPEEAVYRERRVINPRKVGLESSLTGSRKARKSGQEDSILYPMRRPGRVVALKDPETGRALLVGTSHYDDGGTVADRQAPFYDLLRSEEGVVIAPKSRDIFMQPAANGDVVSSLKWEAAPKSPYLYATEIDYDWLGLRDDTLLQAKHRYGQALIRIADARPGDDFADRLDLARAAFSMGGFLEARSVLSVALADNPDDGNSSSAQFLGLVTELLVGHFHEAVPLAMDRDDWSDAQKREILVWRALYWVMTNQKQEEAARILARDFNRMRNTPLLLRDLVMPVAAWTVARYGSAAEFASLLPLPESDPYKLARVLETLKETDPALQSVSFRKTSDDKSLSPEQARKQAKKREREKALEKRREEDQKRRRQEAYTSLHELTLSHDLRVSEQAYEALYQADIADKLDSKTANEVLNHLSSLIFDGRMIGREREIRQLQAEAFIKLGKWNEALTAIDQSGLFPEDRLVLVLGSLAAEALSPEASSGQAQLLTTAASISAHLPHFADDDRKAVLLLAQGRILLQLSLPEEAREAFSTALGLAKTDEDKAQAENGVAQSWLAQKNPDQALSILQNSRFSGLSHPVQTERHDLLAEGFLQKGDDVAALGLLDALNDRKSLLLKASIFEKKQKWDVAIGLLRQILEQEALQAPLNREQEDLILRLANDAHRSHDVLALSWLWQFVGDKPMDSQTEKLFLLLTGQTRRYTPPPPSRDNGDRE